MKCITEYMMQTSDFHSVNEYLSTKVNLAERLEKTINTIIKYFGFTQDYDKFDEVLDYVSKWCKSNLISNYAKIRPMADKETINDIISMGPTTSFKNMLKRFNTKESANEVCQWELSKTKEEDKFTPEKDALEKIEFWSTENMIACISYCGTIYCWKSQEAFDEASK